MAPNKLLDEARFNGLVFRDVDITVNATLGLSITEQRWLIDSLYNYIEQLEVLRGYPGDEISDLVIYPRDDHPPMLRLSAKPRFVAELLNDLNYFNTRNNRMIYETHVIN